MPDNVPPKYGTSEWFATVDSPMKQMSSPVSYKGDSLTGGLEFTFGTALPLAVGGYPFAYNFTGLGSNNGGFLEKLGIADASDSDRTLGSNYFLPLKDRDGEALQCSSRSSSECRNQTANMYIEGHPSATMGTLPAMLDGVVNMNAGAIFEALEDSLLNIKPKCERVTLPVGSSLHMCRKAKYGDFKGQDLGFQPNVSNPTEAQSVNSRCLEGCAKASFTEMDNCRRDCNRLWWEESRCVPVGKYKKPIEANQCKRSSSGAENTTYTLPTGKKPKKATSVAYSPSAQKTSLKGIRPNGNTESFVSPSTPPPPPPYTTHVHWHNRMVCGVLLVVGILALIRLVVLWRLS